METITLHLDPKTVKGLIIGIIGTLILVFIVIIIIIRIVRSYRRPPYDHWHDDRYDRHDRNYRNRRMRRSDRRNILGLLILLSAGAIFFYGFSQIPEQNNEMFMLSKSNYTPLTAEYDYSEAKQVVNSSTGNSSLKDRSSKQVDNDLDIAKATIGSTETIMPQKVQTEIIPAPNRANSLSKHQTRKYYLQVCMSNNSEGALLGWHRYEAKYPEQVYIAHSGVNERNPYKILLGPFQTKQEADTYRVKEGDRIRNPDKEGLTLLPVDDM